MAQRSLMLSSMPSHALVANTLSGACRPLHNLCWRPRALPPTASRHQAISASCLCCSRRSGKAQRKVRQQSRLVSDKRLLLFCFSFLWKAPLPIQVYTSDGSFGSVRRYAAPRRLTTVRRPGRPPLCGRQDAHLLCARYLQRRRSRLDFS